MAKVYGVYFRSTFKISYCGFEGSEELDVQDFVVCETKNGLEYGQIRHIKTISTSELRSQKCSFEILRLATDSDKEQNEQNLEFEKKAYSIAKDCIKKHDLSMKLILVVSSLDRSKLIIFFVAGGRVDFRRLVRNLAFIFRTRVELRQIGIRDEAKILGGIGMCGRAFCCSTYLNEFNHVSIKMAKTQNLSLNPRKISGCCGRLMCCLQHEQQAYVSLNSESPCVGDKVLTINGEGVVVSRNLLLGEFKVKLEQGSGSAIRVFNVQHIKKLPEN